MTFQEKGGFAEQEEGDKKSGGLNCGQEGRKGFKSGRQLPHGGQTIY